MEQVHLLQPVNEGQGENGMSDDFAAVALVEIRAGSD